MKTITQLDIQVLKTELFIQKLALLETTIKSLEHLMITEYPKLHEDCLKALEMIYDDSYEFEQRSINAAMAHLRSVPLLHDRPLEVEQYRIAKRHLVILKKRLSE